MGSPGSGKTTTAVKLADAIHDISLGVLLTAPGLSQANILNACVPVPDSEYISLLGYRSGESLMQYPKITRDKAVELFVSLR